MLVKEAGGAAAGAGGGAPSPASPPMVTVSLVSDDAKAAKAAAQPPFDAKLGPADAEAADRSARRLHRRAVRRQVSAPFKGIVTFLKKPLRKVL